MHGEEEPADDPVRRLFGVLILYDLTTLLACTHKAHTRSHIYPTPSNPALVFSNSELQLYPEPGSWYDGSVQSILTRSTAKLLDLCLA